VREEFREDYGGGNALDSLDSQKCEFDLHSVEAGLGEAPAEEPITDSALAAEAIGVLLRWLTEGFANSPDPLKRIALRSIALVWTIQPASLGGVSCAELARRIGVIKKQCLSTYCSEVHRIFGVSNRAQSHGRAAFERGLERQASQEAQLDSEETEAPHAV
jgi:hypothetical protein